MNIAFLPDADQHPLWPDILALLGPAAEVGGIEPYEPGDLVWIAQSDGVVWAAIVTRLRGGVAEIRCAGGTRLHEWMAQCESTICQWAQDCGADWLELRGRKGWMRFAKRFGWHFSHTDNDGLPVFEKPIVPSVPIVPPAFLDDECLLDPDWDAPDWRDVIRFAQ